MRWINQGIVGSILILGLTTGGAAQESKPPVRAKEPTVVTVHGKPAEVKPEHDAQERDRNIAEKGVRSIGRGTAWVGRRIAGWLDFNADGDNVIPSERERKQKQEKSSRER